MSSSPVLRFGILGAARIAPRAIVQPVRQVAGTAIVGVAARDVERARRFAARHQIARAYEGYDALLDDPEIDAIYNPLPNSLHAEWSIRAMRAGKHVLCEKPFASNSGEAEAMAAVAQETGLVLMEAFHYCYHPANLRLKEIVESGEIGAVRHIESYLCTPMRRLNDIRLRYELAGGALMDLGCYTIHMVRFLAGAEPEVVAAQAKLIRPNVDRRMEADMRFEDGRTARIVCSLLSSTLLRLQAIVHGEHGTARIDNPLLPMLYHRIVVKTDKGTRTEKRYGESTYTYQLRAFVDAVQKGRPLPTGPEDAVANMRVIDAIYRCAGLPLRGT